MSKKITNTWDGFPDEYKNMLLAIFHTGGDICVFEAIRFLKKHTISELDTQVDAKMTYLKWADRFFRLMYPANAFTKEENWKENLDDLEAVLACMEACVKDLAGDYWSLRLKNRTETANDDKDLVNLIQRIDLYWCTLFWFQNKIEAFSEKIGELLKATERNMAYILSHDKAEELMEMNFDGMDGMMELEFNCWEPLSWACHEGGRESFPEYLINAYELYIEFLQGLDTGIIDVDVRDKVVSKAESDLQWLYRCDFEKRLDDGLIPTEHYGDYFCETLRKIHKCESRDSLSSKNLKFREAWTAAKDCIREKNGKISYKTWFEPLSVYHVDEINNILYLAWPNEEKLLDYINRTHLEQIKKKVKEFAPEIEDIVILPFDEDLQNKYYHKRYGGFTRKLRDYLNAYSTLPVVVFRESDYENAEEYDADLGITQCVIGYAYDPDNRFKEKVIAIYVGEGRNARTFLTDAEEEVPF